MCEGSVYITHFNQRYDYTPYTKYLYHDGRKCKSTICKHDWSLKIICTILPDEYVMVIHSLKRSVHSCIQAVFLQSPNLSVSYVSDEFLTRVISANLAVNLWARIFCFVTCNPRVPELVARVNLLFHWHFGNQRISRKHLTSRVLFFDNLENLGFFGT